MDFRADLIADWPQFETRWQALAAEGAATPFQSPAFLRLWYATFISSPRIEPVLVAAVDVASGRDMLLLPLICQREAWHNTISFADLWATDCNAPVISPALPRDEATARHVWSAVRASLPPADLIRLTKMPLSLGPHVNPLAMLADVRASPFTRHLIRVPGTWTDHMRSLDRHDRKELGRSLRLFEAAGTTRFLLAEDAGQAGKFLAVIDGFQRARLEQNGVRNVFGEPGHRKFYEELAGTVGQPGQNAVVGALELDGEIVGGVLAITAGTTATLLRIGHKGGALARLGLGRLAVERTLQALSARGYTTFDFSIGDGLVKRLFRAQPEPLVEFEQALTWRGHAAVAAANAKRHLQSSNMAAALKTRFLPSRPRPAA